MEQPSEVASSSVLLFVLLSRSEKNEQMMMEVVERQPSIHIGPKNLLVPPTSKKEDLFFPEEDKCKSCDFDQGFVDEEIFGSD